MDTHAAGPGRLSSPVHAIAPYYDVVVVGSGYGGAIAASRLARTGRRVCLLERGREYVAGDFPRTGAQAADEIQIDGAGLGPSGLFDFRRNDDMNVLVGCGLGGTSLINAGVALPADGRVFDDGHWPQPLRADGALDTGYQRATAMLRPTPVPENIGLPKLEALKKAAAQLGADFYRPPVAVTFQDGTNAAGVAQPACRLCGDCVSGCNYGAKNTVAMNYLPDARNHGAEIYTEVRVHHVERCDTDTDTGDGGWLVHYDLPGYGRDRFDAPALFVRARVVVLAAGTLGSTEILLRSQRQGLPVSAQLGHRFTGNGDVLAFAYNCDVPVRGVGFGDDDGDAVGPCIGGIIDLRRHGDLDDGMVIEEGVVPGALSGVLGEALAAAAALGGVDTDDGALDRVQELARQLRSLLGGSDGDAVANTLTYLVMTHDDAGGRMHLDGDRLRITWPDAGRQEIFEAVRRRLVEATGALGGEFVPNPLASPLLGQDLVTVHPLGGCAMGEDAGSGVVDHKGRVFAGTDGTEVHDGLYVCDGAVVPRPLGVNPLLTISALAERCSELIATDRGWTVDAEPSPTPRPAVAPQQPGVSFTERMQGYFSTRVTDDYQRGHDLGRADGSPLAFTFTILIDDLDHFRSDTAHEARIVGTVEAPALSDTPLVATGGTLNLLVAGPADDADPASRRMQYRTTLTSRHGTQYFLDGVKIVRDDHGFDMWPDTTSLFVTVSEGGDGSGRILGTGILRIRPADLGKQLTTMRAIGASTPQQRATALVGFGNFFAGSLARVYGPVPSRTPARQPTTAQIPQYTLDGVRDAEITTHYLSTDDGLGLSMLRFRRGEGGDAVLVIHGLTTSTDMFVMPEHRNLVSCLLDEGYDVWCLDFRMSNRHSYNLSYHRYTLDDCALFDFPPAVAEIRRHIGDRRLHVIAHCLGSASFSMSLFGGAVDGITSLIANSIALTPRVPRWSRVKLAVAPRAVELAGMQYLNPRWSQDPWLTPGKLFSRAVSLLHRECDVAACHMLSMMWGTGWPALYNHDNLDERTHRRGGDLYGPTSMHYYRHVRRMVRAGNTAVKYRPGNPDHAPLPDNYFDRAREVTTPVLFMTGADNRVFTDSNIECHRRLAELGCTQHELLVVPGYGHQDVFMGRNAATDVFPPLLDFIRRHNHTATHPVRSP